MEAQTETPCELPPGKEPAQPRGRRTYGSKGGVLRRPSEGHAHSRAEGPRPDSDCTGVGRAPGGRSLSPAGPCQALIPASPSGHHSRPLRQTCRPGSTAQRPRRGAFMLPDAQGAPTLTFQDPWGARGHPPPHRAQILALCPKWRNYEPGEKGRWSPFANLAALSRSSHTFVLWN